MCRRRQSLHLVSVCLDLVAHDRSLDNLSPSGGGRWIMIRARVSWLRHQAHQTPTGLEEPTTGGQEKHGSGCRKLLLDRTTGDDGDMRFLPYTSTSLTLLVNPAPTYVLASTILRIRGETTFPILNEPQDKIPLTPSHSVLLPAMEGDLATCRVHDLAANGCILVHKQAEETTVRANRGRSNLLELPSFLVGGFASLVRWPEVQPESPGQPLQASDLVRRGCRRKFPYTVRTRSRIRSAGAKPWLMPATKQHVGSSCAPDVSPRLVSKATFGPQSDSRFPMSSVYLCVKKHVIKWQTPALSLKPRHVKVVPTRMNTGLMTRQAEQRRTGPHEVVSAEGHARIQESHFALPMVNKFKRSSISHRPSASRDS
ncbi:hypothetical protein LIA77_09040 [Sarocladium implicatum]|nr:hypothetical protein LIA77_09040 [Sarocladium implicatum]